jgi:hypothetical protein
MDFAAFLATPKASQTKLMEAADIESVTEIVIEVKQFPNLVSGLP